MERIIGLVAREKVNSVEQDHVLVPVLKGKSIEDGDGTDVVPGKSSRYKVQGGAAPELL